MPPDHHLHHNHSSTTTSAEQPEFDRLSAVVKASILLAIIIWTTFSNLMVFVLLYKIPKLRTVPNLLVGNLAISDFSVGIFVLPLATVYSVYFEWNLGQLLCELWLSLDILICTASIWTLSMIGLDRYWAITCPVQYMGKRNYRTAAIMVLAVWLFSAAISVAPFLGWRFFSTTGNHIFDNKTRTWQCMHFQDLPSFTIYSAIGSFYIPLLMMFYVYFRIYKAFQKHKRRQIYRQKVIKKHIESTILADLSHVLPTSDEFAKSEDFDDDLDDDEEEEADESDATNKQGSGGDTGSLHSTQESHPVVGSAKPRLKRTLTAQQSATSSLPPYLTYERLRRHKRRKEIRAHLRKSLQHKPTAISAAKERRGVKVLGIVLGCFALCWGPFFIYYLAGAFCKSCAMEPNLEQFITWLGYVNSAINPIIYTVFNRDYQNALKKLFSKKSTKHSTKSGRNTGVAV